MTYFILFLITHIPFRIIFLKHSALYSIKYKYKFLSCIYNFCYTGYSGFGVGRSVLLSRIDEYSKLEIWHLPILFYWYIFNLSFYIIFQLIYSTLWMLTQLWCSGFAFFCWWASLDFILLSKWPSPYKVSINKSIVLNSHAIRGFSFNPHNMISMLIIHSSDYIRCQLYWSKKLIYFSNLLMINDWAGQIVGIIYYHVATTQESGKKFDVVFTLHHLCARWLVETNAVNATLPKLVLVRREPLLG